MTDQPRAAVIARRLQVLEFEAAVQRATLAATLTRLQTRPALSWLTQAAKVAGGFVATPTAKWILTALLMRVIRGR
jgi:hypothetical protein